MKLFTHKGPWDSEGTTYYATGWIAIVAVTCCIIAICMVGCPSYNVWQQEMSGKAEFAKAEQNRRIKIEEAKANLEAEKLNAQAEIERAKVRQKPFGLRTDRSPRPIFSICGCANRITSPTR